MQMIMVMKLFLVATGNNESQLLLWLQDLNLSNNYFEQFSEQRVTFDILTSLTDSELIELLKDEIHMRVIDRFYFIL